jgi:hypothetical protein
MHGLLAVKRLPNVVGLYNPCKKGCHLWPVRARSPKSLVIDGPGAHNRYFLYHNDYKAGWQAEEDLGSIGAGNYTTLPRTALVQGSRLTAIGTRGPPRPIGGARVSF